MFGFVMPPDAIIAGAERAAFMQRARPSHLLQHAAHAGQADFAMPEANIAICHMGIHNVPSTFCSSDMRLSPRCFEA